MPAEIKSSSAHPFTTWKEIAAFFSRDVRTVQRWEKEEGLPVHRHLHHHQSSVYAYREELEQWWRERGSSLNHVGLAEEAAPAVETQPAAQPDLAPSEILTAPSFWIAQKMRLAAAVVVLTLGAAVWFAFFRRSASEASPAAIPAIAWRPVVRENYLVPGAVGDLNGDGRDDVAVTVAEAGRVLLLFGGKLPAGDTVLSQADSLLFRSQKNGWLSTSRIADFNGDGLGDLIVHDSLAEPESFRGTPPLYILWGRRQWPRELALPAAADVILRTDWSENMSTTVCNPDGGPADLNGDGREDLILGAYEHTPNGRRSAGGIFVLFGRGVWPREVEIRAAADVTIAGARMGEGLPELCATGDFNGDGRMDLAASASEATLWNLLKGRKRVYLFLGREKWPKELEASSAYDFRMDGNEEHGYASPVLADVNGDRRDDLLVPMTIRRGEQKISGELLIWFGGKGNRGVVEETASDVRITSSAEQTMFGISVLARDVDGDGLNDLIIPEPGVGRISLLLGRQEWKKSGSLTDFGAAAVHQGEPGAGFTTLRAGDLDGDQLAKLIFAAPLHSRIPGASGKMWVLNPYLRPRFDVRPGSEPNILYLPGLLVARLYGQSGPGPLSLDPSTVRVAGVAPGRTVQDDFDHDGFQDFQFYFETGEMRVTPETRRVTLLARTRSGLPVAASDTVQVLVSRPGVVTETPQAPRP